MVKFITISLKLRPNETVRKNSGSLSNIHTLIIESIENF